MRRSIIIILAAVLFLTVLSLEAFSQTGTGQVNGTVTDPSGASVPGTVVTLTNEQTRISDKATTNQNGAFVFINVLPGNYTLQAAATGFKTVTVPSFVVGVRQVVVQNVSLTIGATTQTVQVQSVAPLLQPSSTQLGTVINERATHDLPLNGRNFMELLLLTPGATPISTAQGGSNSGGTPDGGVTTMPGSIGVRPSFQGAQNRSAIYFEDGIINTDFRDNAPGVMPNPDEIQEFTAESHDSRADDGGVIGGTVNIDTKSGTNQFHGSGFEFLRNNAFDARNTFTDRGAPAAYHQHQFGATFGGPIQHDKMFFFVGYSGWRYSKPSQSFNRVPTIQELAGNFAGNQQANAALGLAGSGFGDTLPLYNPYSTAPDPSKPGSYVRQPFMCLGGAPLPANANGTQTAVAGSAPCNIIPSSLINPTMQKLLTTYIDVPNLTGNPSDNFIENQASTNSENDGFVRVDRRFGTRDTAFFRYEEQWDTAISAATPKTSRPTSYYYHTEGGGWTHSFKPNLILDVRGGNLSGPVNSYNISRLGVQPEAQFFPDVSRFSSMELSLASPYSSLANILPNVDNFRNNPGWNISADVNWFKGNHNLQFGYQYIFSNRQQINDFEQFSFTNDITGNPEAPGVTGNSLASALLAYPATFVGQLQKQSALNLNATEWALYVQDQWKFRPKLTINWGLRWDVDPLAQVIGPRTSDAVNIFAQKYYIGLKAAPPLCSASPNADPCLPQPISAIPDNSAIVFNGNHLQVPRSEYHQIGPRIGVAWQVRPNTVVRGGYGIYYDTLVARSQSVQNDLEQLAWPYTTGFSGSVNNPNSAGVPAGAAGNPLVPITSIEGSFPSPVPPPTPWTPSGWADDPANWDPYAQEWNVEIQHQFGANMMVSAAYVGSKSGDLPYTGPNADAAKHPSPAGTPLTTIDSLRAMPFMEGAPLYYTQNLGIANYDALELQFQRRFSNAFQTQVNFTWSKSLDESSGYYEAENGPGGPAVQNYFDPRSNYGLSGYDVPKFLTWYTTYELPFGSGNRWLTSGPASWIVGGWQTNFIMQARSGQNFTPGLNAGDIANLFGTDTAGVRGYERPNLVGNPFSGVQPGFLFNPAAFAVPASGTFGNVGPHTVRDTAVFDMDFSLFRNIPLGHNETRYLQLRIESFNLFNDMNWGTPNTTINAKGAGSVTSLAVDPREFQFALRLVF